MFVPIFCWGVWDKSSTLLESDSDKDSLLESHIMFEFLTMALGGGGIAIWFADIDFALNIADFGADFRFIIFIGAEPNEGPALITLLFAHRVFEHCDLRLSCSVCPIGGLAAAEKLKWWCLLVRVAGACYRCMKHN